MRILISAALFLVSFHVLSQSNPPQAEKGTLDARAWDFTKQKIALNGNWRFYKNQFVLSTDTTNNPADISPFPEVWDQSVQYGTYHLVVVLPADTGKYAIQLPQIYSSYELWVNGKKIGDNGKIGTTKETTTPQWLPQVLSFEAENDSLSIVLHIANFYHFKGGSKEQLYLGNQTMLEDHYSMAVLSVQIESIGLALLGISFLLIYYLREERKKITLYFSLLCLSWAIRSEFSNIYVFISYFPEFDWATMVRIEYIMLFLTMIWAVLFLSRLFPNESNKIVKYVLVATNCIFIALAIVTSAVFFTRWLDFYLVVAAILLIFCTIIIIRAWINERSGVRFVVASVFLSLALFGYDITVYEGFFYYYNPLLFSFGYLAIFLMMGVSLFYHLQIFKGDGSSGMLTYEDLYGKEK